MTIKLASSAEIHTRLRGIDACRGLAALLVVLYHAEITVSKQKYFAADPFHGGFHFGMRGVDFFFVLSGFIITYAHWSDFGRPGRIGSYAFKRFIRIFPILWVVAIPFIAISFLIDSEYAPRFMYERIEVVFTSLFLVPSRLLPMPGVLWTLKHEIFFYTLFAFAIWKPKLGVVALVTWFILCISHVSASGSTGFLLDFCASLYSIEFMLGVGCGIALRSFRVPLPAMMIAAGGLLFGLAGASFEAVKSAQPWIANGTTLSQVAQFGLASVLIVLGVGQMDVDRKTVVPSAIGLLGSASYSIYLIHYPTISVCCKILKRLTPAMPLTPIVASVIVVLISVTTGIMLHKWVEVPLMKAFRPKKHRLDNENLADRTRENVARNGFDEG